MAFFPRNFYQADNASFTPLFRLLDGFDSYSRQGQSCRQARAPQWQPKFDVRETPAAYELHGELPGMNKEDVHIEFTEPQTVTIRGKTIRSYTSSAPAPPVEDAEVAAPATESSEEQQRPRSPHQATVEDEFESISHESGTATPTETEKTEPEKTEPVAVETPQPAQKKPADKAKYWLTERSIGEFARSFNFPTRVDQDTVSASFQDGILTIVVPKAKKHESRRITVF